MVRQNNRTLFSGKLLFSPGPGIQNVRKKKQKKWQQNVPNVIVNYNKFEACCNFPVVVDSALDRSRVTIITKATKQFSAIWSFMIKQFWVFVSHHHNMPIVILQHKILCCKITRLSCSKNINKRNYVHVYAADTNKNCTSTSIRKPAWAYTHS